MATKFRDLMMMKMVLETLVQYRHLMWLMAREDFIKSTDQVHACNCTGSTMFNFNYDLRKAEILQQLHATI
jgi:hypothetical protein